MISVKEKVWIQSCIYGSLCFLKVLKWVLKYKILEFVYKVLLCDWSYLRKKYFKYDLIIYFDFDYNSVILNMKGLKCYFLGF